MLWRALARGWPRRRTSASSVESPCEVGTSTNLWFAAALGERANRERRTVNPELLLALAAAANLFSHRHETVDRRLPPFSGVLHPSQDQAFG